MPLIRAFKLFWTVLIFFTALLNAQSAYKYSYVPKMVYENQIVPLTVLCVSECSKHTPSFTFDAVSNVQPYSDEPTVIQNGDDTFYTFYFKAEKIDVHIPRLFIDNGREELSLEPQTIPLGILKGRDDFCGVLAADMKIINSQVSNYDETNYLVTLSMSAYEANLEDMSLKNVLESGIEHIIQEKVKVEGEFYVVIPASQKKLKFTYFNTIKKQYVYLQVPIELRNTSVATQTDLNPKEDSFELLKKYTFMILVGFFFVMFLFKRDFFYLVLGVVALITLLTFYIPLKKICVKQGAPLYILPTETSTISTEIDEEQHTSLLGEHGSYNKIEYKEGIIGWVKDEDICEN